MKKIFPIACFIVCMALTFSAAWPGDLGTEIQQSLPAGYEPSGVVWHPHFNSLFLVSDGGTLSKMNIDGTVVANWNVGGDLEGVTVADPNSNYVYMAVEYPFEIIRFNASRGGISARVSLTGIVPATANANSGIEAITFVPNGYHKYQDAAVGGLFYFGVQENGKIYVVDVNFASGTAGLVDSFAPVSGRNDISGLHFSTETKTLYVLYDGANMIREITSDNSFISEYSAPGYDQEGITILPGCPSTSVAVVIAEDSGRVMRYGGLPISCPAAEVDADSDGYNSNADCNDNNAQINPGKIEVLYDGVDNDCNPATMDTADADNDAYNSNADCNDNNAQINPGKIEILYNGIDDDCNANTADVLDADADGFNSNMDCNDGNAAINPGKTEIIGNGLDDDCNAQTPDEAAPEKTTIEAEQMATLYGGKVVRLADSVAFYSNGYAQESRTFAAGTYKITVYARADIVSGKKANMRITLDGKDIGNYAISSSTFMPVAFTNSLAQGQHTIRVRFTNDYYSWWTSPPKDLNLYVDKIVFEK